MNSIKQQTGLVVIGEAHQIKNTYLTEHYIIEHFVRSGYRNIFIESGIAEAVILNEYLKTGDEKLLEQTRASLPAYKEFIQKLRQLNEEHQNIDLTGLDFE